MAKVVRNLCQLAASGPALDSDLPSAAEDDDVDQSVFSNGSCMGDPPCGTKKGLKQSLLSYVRVPLVVSPYRNEIVIRFSAHSRYRLGGLGEEVSLDTDDEVLVDCEDQCHQAGQSEQ